MRTMETAGRAVVFSGVAVALGLALLLFMPLPFMRSMGVGGFLIPLVSIAAAVDAPAGAALALRARAASRAIARSSAASRAGRRRRAGLLGAARALDHARGRSCSCVGGDGVLLAARDPGVLRSQLTPGSTDGIPRHPQSVQGFDVLAERGRRRARSRRRSVIVDTRPGRTARPTRRSQAAIEPARRRAASATRRCAASRYRPARPLRRPDAAATAQVVDRRPRTSTATPQAQAFVHRLRGDDHPGGAASRRASRVLAGGGPPQGVDFLDRAYAVFPWLVLAVLRAHLPAAAARVPLAAAAAEGGAAEPALGRRRLRAARRRLQVGRRRATRSGLYQFDQIEGWIPIFLFAMLFGLSMDYEVFLVTRMREAWDDDARQRARGRARARAHRAGSSPRRRSSWSPRSRASSPGAIVGLQQFGFGLAVAILLDATIVRALLVPSADGALRPLELVAARALARVVRVQPSPLEPAPQAGAPPGGPLDLVASPRDGDVAEGRHPRRRERHAARTR